VGFTVICGELARAALVYFWSYYTSLHLTANGLRFVAWADLNAVTTVAGLAIMFIVEVFRAGSGTPAISPSGGCVLFHARQAGLGAFRGDGQVADHRVVADNEGVRVGGRRLAIAGSFFFASFEVRVIGDEHVGAGLAYNVAEAGGRLDVGVEPELVGAIRCDVGRAAAQPVESGSSQEAAR
jgi:hypothetical protein